MGEIQAIISKTIAAPYCVTYVCVGLGVASVEAPSWDNRWG